MMPFTSSRSWSPMLSACHKGTTIAQRNRQVACRAAQILSKVTSGSDLEISSAPSAGPDYHVVTRNLALELVRVTEAAALASARWLGKGDKIAADQAAVDAMRKVLSSISMDGVVVIGEGEKDEAPMLYCGEQIGDGNPPSVDIAVDPLDGTSLTAKGMNGAVSVISLAERGSLFDPGPCMYMDKLVVGPEAAGLVSLDYTVTTNLQLVAKSMQKAVNDVTVVILDRPRHADIIKECRQAGARVKLISDGDVAASIAVATADHPLDMLLGVGGSPEGVITACAMKCLGGSIQCRLWPRNEEERQKAVELGYSIDKQLGTDDLVTGQEIFFAATGVSDGDLLRGVRFFGGGASSHSIVMRSKSGTVRRIETSHTFKNPTITNHHLGQ